MLGKIKTKLTSMIGVILMVSVTVILAMSIAAIVFGLGGFQNQYYKIQTVKQLDEDTLLVKTINYSKSPLPNVTLTVLEHGEGRLLTGPYVTNESGYVIIPIPQGYEELFDIVGDYENVTNTITIDKRPMLVKSEAYLGSLGIAIITAIFTAVITWFLSDWKNKKRWRQMKSKKESEDNTNP